MTSGALKKALGSLRGRMGRTKPEPEQPDTPESESETVIRPTRFHTGQPAGGAAPARKVTKAEFARTSALLLIALPTLLAIIYFGFIASQQYASHFQFAVRSNERSASEQLGLLSQLSSTPLNSDSYIVVEYLKSRQFIEDITKKINFKEIYTTGKADWLSRMSGAAPVEDIVDYWQKRIDVHYDAQTGIVTAEVRAFTPEESKKVAQAALELSARLINQLSRKAREERLALAEADVKRMEIRVATAMATIKKFRDRTGIIDPAKSAVAGAEILGKFQEELARLKTQLAILTRTMDPSALPVVNLKQRIKAMEDQIASTRAQVGASGKKSALPELSSQLLGEYESLALEKGFAEKAYLAAMQALEVARAEAMRNQRYLSVFVRPHLPEHPTHPKRLLMIFAVFAFSFLGWAILSLTYLTIKDHIL